MISFVTSRLLFRLTNTNLHTMPKITIPKLTQDQLQRTPCPTKRRRGQQLPRCFDCFRGSDECRFQSAFNHTPPIVGENSIILMLNLTDKRLYNGMRNGNVGFDFEGPSRPPTYRQRMDQKDTLRSIRTKMVGPFPSWSPRSHCCIQVCPRSYPWTSTSQWILAHHF